LLAASIAFVRHHRAREDVGGILRLGQQREVKADVALSPGCQHARARFPRPHAGHWADFGDDLLGVKPLPGAQLAQRSSLLSIDRMLQRAGCAGSHNAARLCTRNGATIVNLARTLNLDVIAEGAETAAQVEFLEGLECR
jgi:hypothetical protein